MDDEVTPETPPAPAAERGESLIEVEGLRVTFPVYGGVLRTRVGGVRAVDGVDFTVRRGEVLGLVGESGSGKTTVGRAIINLLRFTTPGVELDGAIRYGPDGTDMNGLRRQGMRRVLGPFNLSINHECGMLVEGFQTPPMVMMGHSRPYYEGLIERQGYQPEIDLLAYLAATDIQLTPAMKKISQRYANVIRLRAFDFSRLNYTPIIRHNIV